MKTVAKGAAVLITVFCAVFFGYAQEPTINTVARATDEKLPLLLRPSDYAVNRAKEMGGEVFKLLPFRFRDPTGLNHYYYPSQGSYSFKNRSHGSHQITYLDGEFRTGGPWDFGFFADLGERDLREVDSSSPDAKYFLSYKPPYLDPDIRREIERLNDTKEADIRLTRSVAVHAGHTYLLRSIDFDQADTAVVLYVLEISTDGSITIVWKKLADFPVPPKLFMSDEEMQKKVDAVLAELQIRGLQIKIEDNMLIPIGVDVDQAFDRFREALHERKIQYRGINFSMLQRSSGKIPK